MKSKTKPEQPTEKPATEPQGTTPTEPSSSPEKVFTPGRIAAPAMRGSYQN
jgi:hypothetical protein